MVLSPFSSKPNDLGHQPAISRHCLLPYTLFLLLFILMLFSCRPAWAEDVGLYGPVQFTRTTGKPAPVQQTLAVTNPAVSYRLHIVNGGLQGTTQIGNPVSSATIYWNGSPIAGTSAFNPQIPTLTLPVSAHLANTLAVELQGKPGSSITVQLLRGNQIPIAHAGADQTLYVGEAAKLDGSASTDSDGDALSYRWRITEAPANSLSQLSDSTAIHPEFPIDAYGRYQAELIVNDGELDSEADLVAIDTQNSKPVADAGPDQSNKTVGMPVELDGSLSSDADALTYISPNISRLVQKRGQCMILALFFICGIYCALRLYPDSIKQIILFLFLFQYSSVSFSDTYPAILLFSFQFYINNVYMYPSPPLTASSITEVCALHEVYKKNSSYTFSVSGYNSCQINGYGFIFGYNPVSSCPYGGTTWGNFRTGWFCINATPCPSPQIRNATTGICETPACPAGQLRDQSQGKNKGQCVSVFASSNNGGGDCRSMPPVGNPINPAIGNKFQIETDVAENGPFPLSLVRTYNSSTSATTTLGAGWQHSYERFISVLPGGAVEAMRPDGKAYTFSVVNGVYSAADINDTLQALMSGSVINGWHYVTTSGETETYNLNGQLLAITDRSGLSHTLAYDANAHLSSVTDNFGRQLQFTYDSNNRVNSLIDPAGGLYHYAYDANNNLSSVTYPDGSSKSYHYENSALPHALTGITDENGNRYATYGYDAQGHATLTEHAGGAERASLVYNADGSTTVTDALNASRTYNFQTILGVVKSIGQSQPGGSGCSASASSLSYDANGNVASRTDFNGNLTTYSYDLTRNLETSRTEGLTSSGATTPATRTITTAWHPTFRLPVKISNGNLEASYDYNNQGDLTQKVLQDSATNTTRSWNFSYTYSAVPGVLSQKVEDGPRTDVSDLTTYDYYPADATCDGNHPGCRGQLMQITDALGHITRVTRYSALGQLQELTDPNGLITTLTYDARQRLTSLEVGGETTTYSYDPAGQVTRVIRPDGAYLAYRYDAAHRLINIQDQLGNSLSYTLDAMGNRLKEEVYDPGGQLARSQSRVYDALSRLQNLVLPQ